MEQKNDIEQIIIELPRCGAWSYETLERCAREAEIPLADWLQDAIIAYVRVHERDTRMGQIEVFGAPMSEESAPITKWRLRLGEYAYRLADALTKSRDK